MSRVTYCRRCRAKHAQRFRGEMVCGGCFQAVRDGWRYATKGPPTYTLDVPNVSAMHPEYLDRPERLAKIEAMAERVERGEPIFEGER